MTALLTGVVPVVPTIFHDDETVDLDGTARVVDYLIDGGVDGLCLLANYSEQFSLTDAERDAIAGALLERVAGRLPVIVTTSHYSARVAAARSRAAQDMGAAMVMIMPPFFGATLTVPGRRLSSTSGRWRTQSTSRSWCRTRPCHRRRCR